MNTKINSLQYFTIIFTIFLFYNKAISQINDDIIITKSRQIINLLNTINYEKVALIPVFDFTVCDAEYQLQQLQLQIKKNKFTIRDSTQYWLDSATTFTYYNRTRINQYLANIDDVYYKKAVTLYNNNDTTNAMILLEKAIAVNNFFVPAHILRAKILLEQKQYDNAIQIIDYIHKNTWRNTNHQIQYTQLQYAVYWKLLKDAEDALNNQDYNISLDILQKAIDYCKKKYIVCDEQLTNTLSKAHYGMFDSYLRIAQKASATSNMRFAENYLLRAIEYREQYADMINITINLDTLLNKIIEVYLQNGLQYIKINDFTNAILSFDKVEQRCKNLSKGNCNDKIINTIYAAKFSIYAGMLNQAKNQILQKNINFADSLIFEARIFREKHTKAIPFTNELDTIVKLRDIQWARINIENGKNYLYLNQIDSALNCLQNALFIAQFYRINLDTTLSQLFYSTTQKYILYHLEEARLKAWANKFDTAWQIFQNTENFKNKKLLYADETVDSILQYTQKYIKQKQCNYLQIQLNQYLEYASISLSHYKYYEAFLWFEKSILLSKNTICPIDTSTIQQQINTIAIPASFQRKIFELESYFQLKQFTEAIENYQTTKQLYQKENIQQWNIQFPAINKLIPENYNSQELITLAEKLIQFQLAEECIELLKILQTKGIKNSKIKKLMTQCAKIAAQQDFEKDNKKNPDTLLLHYGIKNKWFKPFQETYKKTWQQNNNQKNITI